MACFAAPATACMAARPLTQAEGVRPGKPALSCHLVRKCLLARPHAKYWDHVDEWASVFVLEEQTQKHTVSLCREKRH